MYFKYWGLRERPFQNIADVRFAYLSDQHREGLARLLYLVEEQKLGGTLVGPYGVGKSMVIELLAEKVRGKNGEHYLQFDAPLSGALSLAKQLVANLGHTQPVNDISGALEAIQNHFSDANPNAAHLVLVIDEAQLLRAASDYEFFHLLCNVRMRRRDGGLGAQAITLLLVGHQDLVQHLAAEQSLAQRLQLFWRLEPLNEQQSIEYVQHRVRAAGGDIWIFDEAALAEVHLASQGVPRLINHVCDTALLIGCAMHAPRITAAIMRQAVAEVHSPLMQSSVSTPGVPG
jgi:general secretion pathway protein A